MALLKIVEKGDDILSKKCKEIDEISPKIITLLEDMKETLVKAGGVGLAAPQVGHLKRLAIVLDLREPDNEENPKFIELINPEIIRSEGEQYELEGCLSYPDHWGYRKRPGTITVRALDRNGKEFEIEGDGLLARAFSHEIDHLNGIVFWDDAEMLSKEEVNELFGEKEK